MKGLAFVSQTQGNGNCPVCHSVNKELVLEHRLCSFKILSLSCQFGEPNRMRYDG
jgi:hypothetical protein